jgi:hypothetical protein
MVSRHKNSHKQKLATKRISDCLEQAPLKGMMFEDGASWSNCFDFVVMEVGHGVIEVGRNCIS